MKRFGDTFSAGIMAPSQEVASSTTVKEAGNSRKVETKLSPQEKVFNILESEGVFEKRDGFIIADIEAFKNPELWQRSMNKRIGNDEHNYAKFSPGVVFQALKDMRVVPKEEYKKSLAEKKEIKEIPLFNIPESAKEAFVENNIKNKNYALDPWELYGNVPWKKIRTEAKNGDMISAKELFLATEIFRKLQGHRNEKGELMIFNEGKGDFVKVSATKLRELNLLSGMDNFSINRTLLNCPNLLSSGLVKLDDFEVITNDIGGEINRKEFTSSNLEKPFSVMIDSVRYYIGRKYFIHGEERIPIQNIKVVILDRGSAGIVKTHAGREELIYTFNLLSDEEKSEKRTNVVGNNDAAGSFSSTDLSARTLVGKKEVKERMRKYSASAIIPKRKDESAEEYGQRLSELSSYGYVQNVTKKISREVGVGIHNLSWREQLQIAGMEYESGVLEKDSRFMEFAKKYKLNGLCSFLSLEHGGQEMGDKILKIGEKLDSEKANQIFAKYAELVEASSGVEKYVAQQFGDAAITDAREIAEKLLIRGKKLLELVADNANMSEESLQRILDKIEVVRGDVELFKATFKNMREKEILMPLEKMKDTRVHSFSGKEIVNDQNMIEKMKTSITKNYAEYPEEFQQMIQESFDKKIGDEKVNFEIATYKNSEERELMAFLTMTEQSDGRLYFGSFNINSDIFYGTEIGRALFEETMKEYGQGERPIDAHCNPEEKISKTYIESGFVAVGILDVSGVPSFAITMDKLNNYETQKVSVDELAGRMGEESVNIIIRKKENGDSFPELKAGFALTRYFSYKDDSIVVFEASV